MNYEPEVHILHVNLVKMIKVIKYVFFFPNILQPSSNVGLLFIALKENTF